MVMMITAEIGKNFNDDERLITGQVGGRSAKACATLSEHGVARSRLFNMEGGIIRWAEEVDSSLAVY